MCSHSQWHSLEKLAHKGVDTCARKHTLCEGSDLIGTLVSPIGHKWLSRPLRAFVYRHFEDYTKINAVRHSGCLPVCCSGCKVMILGTMHYQGKCTALSRTHRFLSLHIALQPLEIKLMACTSGGSSKASSFQAPVEAGSEERR